MNPFTLTIYITLTCGAVWYVTTRSELKDELPFLWEAIRDRTNVRPALGDLVAGMMNCPALCRPFWVLAAAYLIELDFTWPAALRTTGVYGLFLAAEWVARKWFPPFNPMEGAQ